jgi:hypothetical protein
VTVVQANHILKGPSGLPEDVIVNTWHFYTSSVAEGDYDNIRDMLKDFYTSIPGSGSPLCTHYPNILNTTATVTIYNLDDPKPRQPIYSSTYGPITWGTGSPLPFEVALCMSFEAEKVSGVKQARRRNRVYLGPFRSATADTDGHPLDSLLTSVVTQGEKLKQAADASISWEWVVFSPTDDDFHPVDRLWCDDAWDTQRRRGLRETKRMTKQF